jgi:hypothetical protein
VGACAREAEEARRNAKEQRYESLLQERIEYFLFERLFIGAGYPREAQEKGAGGSLPGAHIPGMTR